MTMSATATPPRPTRRPLSSAPPSPDADRDAGLDSPLRRSRGFATNLSACAGEEGGPSTESPTYRQRKSERISQWRANVSPSITPKTGSVARGNSPYTPKTHSALARAMIDTSDSEDDEGRPPRQARARPPAQLTQLAQGQQQRTPPASSRKLQLGAAFNMSPLPNGNLNGSPAPAPAKVRFLAEPMRRYNSLPTPPAAWSPSRVPRSIGLYDLNLHATPPKSKYQPKKLDLGGPLPARPFPDAKGPLTPSPEIEINLTDITEDR